MATSKSTVSLKLLIHTKRNKVMFAEAGKDTVDFLFKLLMSLPISAVISAVAPRKGLFGSLGDLHGSVQTLSRINNYTQPLFSKNDVHKSLAFNGPRFSTIRKPFYYCQHCRVNYSNRAIVVSEYPEALCPLCHRYISSEALYVVAPTTTTATGQTCVADQGGNVKGHVTDMITDDLQVKPRSTISSCVTVLNKFNIKYAGVLGEFILAWKRVRNSYRNRGSQSQF